MFSADATEPAEGIDPYSPLRLAGRDVYVREGCYNCHSQMIRPFRSETERYGPYTTAGETVYDRPFQFGSKRTGPDLARVTDLGGLSQYYLDLKPYLADPGYWEENFGPFLNWLRPVGWAGFRGSYYRQRYPSRL